MLRDTEWHWHSFEFLLCIEVNGRGKFGPLWIGGSLVLYLAKLSGPWVYNHIDFSVYQDLYGYYQNNMCQNGCFLLSSN